MLFLMAVGVSFAQQKEIKGVVKDEAGIPLPGATIMVKGDKTGTQTDFDGNYTIKVSEGKILVFSFVGMASVEKKWELLLK